MRPNARLYTVDFVESQQAENNQCRTNARLESLRNDAPHMSGWIVQSYNADRDWTNCYPHFWNYNIWENTMYDTSPFRKQSDDFEYVVDNDMEQESLSWHTEKGIGNGNFWFVPVIGFKSDKSVYYVNVKEPNTRSNGEDLFLPIANKSEIKISDILDRMADYFEHIKFDYKNLNTLHNKVEA